MKLHHYVFICFFLMAVVLTQVKGSYSAASYNPVKDEVVTYQENTPPHVYAHENVHRVLWWESYLIFFAAVAVMLGLISATRYTAYPYLFYVLLSVHAEVTAYLLTPVSPMVRVVYVSVILLMGYVNLLFWRYLFFTSDLSRPVRQFTRRDWIFPPYTALLFWLV